MAGTLTVVGTPIGNLSDLSPRAAEALAACDFIAAEDTRVTLKLLNHLGIKKPMVSYFEHNKAARGDVICARLEAGENGVIVTDAGMPCISDPGELLVAQCAARGIPVTVVPGPSALIAALAVSGLPTGRFTFEGFLSVTKKSRRAHLDSLLHEQRTMIFYEAPHKLAATLAERGAAGYVRASGSQFVVPGACYYSADDARRVAQRLSADEQLRTDVLTLSAPGASLRVTAAESDCAASADADAALRAQLDQRSQIALQLDRGEIEPKQARTLAAVARSELTAAREALSDVAGAVDNPVCIGLTDQLDALAATLGEIARGSDAAAALAGRLRCAHVSATLSLIDFLSALA